MKLKLDALLASKFVQIPEDNTVLDLTGDYLGRYNRDTLVDAFAAVPPRFTTVVLNKAGLNQQTDTDLAEGFQVLHKGVTTLSLSSNQLGELSVAKLVAIIKAIPAGVTE